MWRLWSWDTMVPPAAPQALQMSEHRNLGWKTSQHPLTSQLFTTSQTLRTTNVTMCCNIVSLHFNCLYVASSHQNISLCILELNSKLIRVTSWKKTLLYHCPCLWREHDIIGKSYLLIDLSACSNLMVAGIQLLPQIEMPFRIICMYI